jgi:hypothetical protein
MINRPDASFHAIFNFLILLLLFFIFFFYGRHNMGLAIAAWVRQRHCRLLGKRNERNHKNLQELCQIYNNTITQILLHKKRQNLPVVRPQVKSVGGLANAI